MTYAATPALELVYLFDGTLEGMLTAVFEAFARRENPTEIVTECNLQQSLMQSYVPIQTDVEHAARVQSGIIDMLGLRAYEDVKRVFLCDEGRKGGILLRYLQHTLKRGARSRNYLANPAIADFEELLLQVRREQHYMLQFVRFSQLQNGVFFSKIRPKASVVPLIMDHFAARFNIQPFMIYDEAHGLTGVYDMSKWWLVEARDIIIPAQSEQQDAFESLWQTFYDTIAIEERRNPICQRNFMPKRFWGTMCEQIPPQLRNQRPLTQTPTQAARISHRLSA
ncbi:MAG: TIGR03915 family putative DNA repair protein [Coriobacteriales bacterium]|jgi:probable DNA metabolism protein|nr:TIGR03915 family putative DNA repair protein [Coriobacteriales bacterium]